MADKHPKSLRKVKVAATVEPVDRDGVDEEKCEKIAKGITREVKEVMEKNSDKPSGEQVGQVAEAVAERKEQLDQDGTPVRIIVDIFGTRGEDGTEEIHFVATGEGITEDMLDEDYWEEDN